MADFAASWAAKATNFANRVAWRIVVMHVAAGTVGNFHCINELSIAKWCQSDNVHSLSDATSKETGAVGAWQNANLRAEWANLVELATIWANAFFDNILANVVLNGKLESVAVICTEVLIVEFGTSSHLLFFAHLVSDAAFFVGKFLSEFIMHGILELIEELTALDGILSAELIIIKLAFHPSVNLSLNFFARKNEAIFELFNADLLAKFVLKLDSWLDHLETPFETTDNDIFWDFLSTGFNHGNTGIFASDHEVEVRSFALFWAQEGLIFTVNTTDAETSDWAIKWHAGEHKGARSGDHGDNIWAEAWVHRENRGDNLDFLAITLRE